MQKRVLAVFFLFAVFTVRSQVFIKNLKAQALNPYQALISWTIGSGSQTCTGIEVHWSLDSFTVTDNWLYTVPGICGASGADEDYSYTHPNPDIHKKNYYRIYTPVSGFSGIVFVDFGAINGNYNIYPDPITESTVLTFDNPNSEAFILDVANAKGNKVTHLESITGTQIAIPRNWYEPGMYFFRLFTVSGTVIRGKFIVAD